MKRPTAKYAKNNMGSQLGGVTVRHRDCGGLWKLSPLIYSCLTKKTTIMERQFSLHKLGTAANVCPLTLPLNLALPLTCTSKDQYLPQKLLGN